MLEATVTATVMRLKNNSMKDEMQRLPWKIKLRQHDEHAPLPLYLPLYTYFSVTR
jgi:hypothetical protein